jgi:AraC-type DNA-binding domain-containing proteins
MSRIENQLTLLISAVKINRSEEEIRRIPLAVENEFLDKVKQGKYKEIQLKEFSKLDDGMGVLANKQTTQLVYLVVSFVAILSRVAIDSGAIPDDVFDLSDALLFLLSFTNKPEDIYEIYELSAIRFAKLVHDAKEHDPNYQIIQLQDYISSNIFRKISIQELADYVSLSPNYVCKLFKKELGISAHNYIQKGKVVVACNLLKHTLRPISDVASYMGFETQSNFTAVFHKWMHETPTEYRNKNYREVY